MDARRLSDIMGDSGLTLKIEKTCGISSDVEASSSVARVKLARAYDLIKAYIQSLNASQTAIIRFLPNEIDQYPEAIQQTQMFTKIFAATKNIDVKFASLSSGTLATNNVISLKEMSRS